jgi:hypothetical protein
MVRSPQTPNWMFTINNPIVTDVPLEWPTKFIVFQKEKGENGTEHYQGYAIFNKRMTLSSLKTLCSRAHWEPRKGSHEQARKYCTKDDTRIDGPWTAGDYDPEATKGTRSDLAALKDCIDRGHSMSSIADEHFESFLRYERGIRSYRNLRAVPRDFKSAVHVFYGPTGTGKSHACREISPSAYWYFPQKDSKWWDGYDGEADVVIDEFYGNIPWSSILRLFDKYAMVVETKGGSVNFAPKRIFVTSNKPPCEWYNYATVGSHMSYATLERRLDYIYRVPEFASYIPIKLPLPPPLPPYEPPSPSEDEVSPF